MEGVPRCFRLVDKISLESAPIDLSKLSHFELRRLLGVSRSGWRAGFSLEAHSAVEVVVLVRVKSQQFTELAACDIELAIVLKDMVFL